MAKYHQIRFAMLLAQFSFASFAVAAGKLDPAPEAANEYVRVWSDTIGVHEVQNPDGGLDFWITTTNVVDGFPAEVIVEDVDEETDEDSWRLKEPQSGKRNTMRPGDKLRYVVEDFSGVEPDKPGWIKLYRVDVMIDNVGEASEETDGAFVPYKNAPGGYDDPDLARYLVPVSLRCQTPDDNDQVLIEVISSMLLVRTNAGSLVRAESSYPASELNKLSFFLLGTTLSTGECDQEIVLTHDKTKCRDVAKFSVWASASFLIQEVSFRNGTSLLSDEGEAFSEPQYKDSNHDGVISGTDERAFPICHVRNTSPTIAAKLYHPTAQLVSPIYVRADSPAFRIPPTEATLESDTAISIIAETEHPLADAIDFQDPLPVRWFVSNDGQMTWKSAGISTNRFYATWAASQATKNLETLFYVGCKGGKGVSGVHGRNDNRVVDAIWDNPFSTLSVTTASEGKLLSFFGFDDLNKNGIYDSGEPEYNSANSYNFNAETDSAELLITSGHGQCTTWVKFLRECWYAQGLKSVNGNPVKCYGGFMPSIEGYLPLIGVKKWEWSMNPYFVYPDGDQWFWATLAEANQGLSVSQTSILPSEHCREILGIPGQGNSPNPPAYFARHYWVSDGRFYHDPSFGKRAETLDVISRGVFECYMYQFAEHNGDFAVIKSPPQLTTKEVKE